MRFIARRFGNGALATLFVATQLLSIGLMTQKAFAFGEPLVGVVNPPNAVSNQTTQTFTFTSTQQVDFFCSFDGGNFSLCTDPYTTPTLTEGPHTFDIFGRNLSSLTGPTSSYSWTVDLTPPDTTITSLEPNNVTVNTSRNFVLTSDETSTFECKIDDGSYQSCSSTYVTPDLIPGSHALYVRATDEAGNVDSTPASYGWGINDIEVGDGTPAHPYTIQDCFVLPFINFDLTASYILTKDLDCSGTATVPIGNANNPFIGTFDGNGYTISNLNMTNDGNLGTGLFGATDGANISAVRIVDSSFVEGEANGSYSMGALVGIATDSILTDITSSNLSISTNDGSPNYMGGLVGYLEGTSVLENSQFDGVITNNAGTQNGTGGLVGAAIGTSDVRNSYATGLIEGTNYIGGLIGVMDDSSSLRKSYSDITIDTLGEGIGGLVGYVGSSSSFISHNFSVSNMVVVLHDSSVGALIGMNSGSASNNYFVTYAPDPSGLPCIGSNSGTVANCTGVSSVDYFKGNSSNQPLSSFDQVWNLHDEGQLPSFAIGGVVCDDPPTQSESTLVFGCFWTKQVQHKYSGSAVTRQIRYRLRNSSDPWIYQEGSIESDKIVITRLLPATDYEVQFHTIWQVGSSDWTQATAWLSTGSDANLDTDGDGIKDSVEINGPNLGDANGDHTGDDYSNGDDFNQANVTSLRNPLTGTYVVLQSNCAAQSAVTISPESTNNADSSYNYNSGLLSFTATGCGPTATFTQYFYGTYDASKFVARKYNSVTKTYTTIPGAVLSNVTINGQTALKIVYQITDNSSLDEDATVGTIKDPSGPASVVVGVPNTGIQRK